MKCSHQVAVIRGWGPAPANLPQVLQLLYFLGVMCLTHDDMAKASAARHKRSPRLARTLVPCAWGVVSMKRRAARLSCVGRCGATCMTPNPMQCPVSARLCRHAASCQGRSALSRGPRPHGAATACTRALTGCASPAARRCGRAGWRCR
jgi:hypothetical protein